MKVIPAIDLMGGRCVQLVGGRPETRKDFGDPVERAIDWARQGARMLHLVDLDATLGTGGNLETALKVKRSCGLPVEFGGGIRSYESAVNMLEELGDDDRIILSTLAVNEYPKFNTLRLLEEYQDRIIVSVDSKGGHVAVKGWTESSGLTAVELLKSCEEYVWGFLYTDVDVEGKMQGINPDRVAEVIRSTERPVIISGGITTKADVMICDEAGAWGVVLGKALYEGKISLPELVSQKS